MENGQSLPSKNKSFVILIKLHWPSKMMHGMKGFHFEYSLMHAFNNFTNKPNDMLLTSLLKLFSLFVVKFDHEPTGSHHKLLSFQFILSIVNLWFITKWITEK